MTEKLKILLIEDDPESALRTESIIYHLGYQLMNTIDNSEEALSFIHQNKPDILLLDIEIKGNLNGLEIAERIRHKKIPIIFITGYSDEGVFLKARKSMPVAYLVKPFNKFTFQNALENAMLMINQETQKDSSSNDWEGDILIHDSFFVKRNNLLQKVKIEDIHYIQSEGNYCEIYSTKKYALKMSLSKMLQRLPSKRFIRIHQRYVVQVDLIDNIDITANQIYVQGQKLPLGPKFKENILKIFQRL